jgi:N-acetylneuraminic acid mutarotase
MPTARDHLAVVTLGGKLYAIGGRASFFGEKYGNVEIYDPATDSWRVEAPLPDARGGIAAAVFGGRIFVFGGELPFRIFNAAEMLDPAAGTWVAKAPMPTPRHGMGAAVVGKRIYLPGGGTQPGPGRTNILEAFEP